MGAGRLMDAGLSRRANLDRGGIGTSTGLADFFARSRLERRRSSSESSLPKADDLDRPECLLLWLCECEEEEEAVVAADSGVTVALDEDAVDPGGGSLANIIFHLPCCCSGTGVGAI